MVLNTRKRPLSVTLAALFQFFKGAFFLLIFWGIWRVYSAWASSSGSAGYNQAQQTIGYAFVLVILGIAVAFVILGWGLWNLQKWARDWVIWNTLICWLGGGGLSLNGPLFKEGILMDQWKLRTLICVFVLDMFILCCLTLYPDVRNAFGERE